MMKAVLINIKSKRGVTLIEMTIAVAILFIVIAATYSVFALGNRSFVIGNTQYDIQSDVRLVSNYIENETKYSTEIHLFPDIINPENLEDDYDYITFDFTDGNMIHYIYNEGEHTSRQFGNNITDGSFAVSSNNKELIITITGNNGNQNFNINSQIALPNLYLHSTLGITGESNNAQTIRFKSLAPSLSLPDPDDTTPDDSTPDETTPQDPYVNDITWLKTNIPDSVNNSTSTSHSFLLPQASPNSTSITWNASGDAATITQSTDGPNLSLIFPPNRENFEGTLTATIDDEVDVIFNIYTETQGNYSYAITNAN